MLNVNNVMTNKGGAGKTLICILLGCYFQERGQRTLCIDLDPNQPSFSRYQSSLGVQRVEVAADGKVNGRLFDEAASSIYGPRAREGIGLNDCDQVIIDSGAGGYLPLKHYMRRENVTKVFGRLGYRHTLHVVLAGGQALVDCLDSLDELVSEFGATSRVVVWLNGYNQKLPWTGVEGFCSSGAYRKHGSLIDGIIDMPILDTDTYEPAFAEFLSANMTFTEALASSEVSFNDSLRLEWIRDLYFEQLDHVFGETASLLADAVADD